MRTTCGYCGVGCQVEVGRRERRVVRIDGRRRGGREPRAPLREGPLRARVAARRRTGSRTRCCGTARASEPVSWDEALGFVAERLDAIHRAHGPDALGAITSSRSTNEAAYLLQKLFRVRFGTNHVDCCARVCHASTAQALRAVTGTGAATAVLRRHRARAAPGRGRRQPDRGASGDRRAHLPARARGRAAVRHRPAQDGARRARAPTWRSRPGTTWRC